MGLTFGSKFPGEFRIEEQFFHGKGSIHRVGGHQVASGTNNLRETAIVGCHHRDADAVGLGYGQSKTLVLTREEKQACGSKESPECAVFDIASGNEGLENS
jgi:hypothetical protein